MILPTEKRKPIADVSQEIILLYGVPKIGKSSFAGQFSDALFLSTEEGLNHLEIYETPIKSWQDYLDIVNQIEKDQGHFKTVIVDTVDNLYLFCQNYIYKLHNINHESDMEWGKGWAEVESEFRRQITRLSQIKGLGKIFVSHSEDKEIREKGSKDSITVITHTLPKRARKVLSPMVDIILYMEIDDQGRRVIRTKPTERYEAGDRTGRLPDTLYMGPSPDNAYKNFLSAYYTETHPQRDEKGDDNEARTNIVNQIKKGLKRLGDDKSDGFESEKRRDNSFLKHLECDDLEDKNIPLSKLQSYYQHLRLKWIESKKGEKK